MRGFFLYNKEGKIMGRDMQWFSLVDFPNAGWVWSLEETQYILQRALDEKWNIPPVMFQEAEYIKSEDEAYALAEPKLISTGE